jgi:hypothetical protein
VDTDDSSSEVAGLDSLTFVVIIASFACMAAVPAAFWLADSRLIPWADELAWEKLRKQAAGAGLKVADDDFIALRRTGCFGRCPVYSVKISGSGHVEFIGESYTCAEGTREGFVDPARARKLIHDLAGAGFFSLDWKPGNWISDAPSAITRLSIGERSRGIFHDYGDTGAPRSLEAMEDAVDDVAGTDRWLPQNDGGRQSCRGADGPRVPQPDY